MRIRMPLKRAPSIEGALRLTPEISSSQENYAA